MPTVREVFQKKSGEQISYQMFRIINNPYMADNVKIQYLKVFKLIFYPFPKQKQMPHGKKTEMCGDFLFAEL